jgi:hypothetical protein
MNKALSGADRLNFARMLYSRPRSGFVSAIQNLFHENLPRDAQFRYE